MSKRSTSVAGSLTLKPSSSEEDLELAPGAPFISLSKYLPKRHKAPRSPTSSPSPKAKRKGPKRDRKEREEEEGEGEESLIEREGKELLKQLGSPVRKSTPSSPASKRVGLLGVSLRQSFKHGATEKEKEGEKEIQKHEETNKQADKPVFAEEDLAHGDPKRKKLFVPVPESPQKKLDKTKEALTDHQIEMKNHHEAENFLI